jgi:hypothetical protein
MVVMAVVGAVVVGALALTAYPSLRVASVAGNGQPEARPQPVRVTGALAEARPAPLAAAPVAAVAPTRVPRTIVEKATQTPAVSSSSSPLISVPSPPPAVAADTSAGRVSAETVAREQAAGAPAVATTTTPDTGSQAVTVSGCLETTVDEDQFRLTDTEGADAPKARSWRSGFLRKRSAPVELVELSDLVGLRQYVGRRVVATGLLTGRELRVRSLQSAGTSCN